MKPEITKNHSILILEDDLILSLSLELMLKRLGFTNIFRTEYPEIAIEKAIEMNPQLLLVDIILGNGNGNTMSGVEAVKRIQEKSDFSNVIYITGNSDSHNKEMAEKTRHLDYLIKPVTLTELKDAIYKAFPELLN